MHTGTGLRINAKNAPARRNSYAATGREGNRTMPDASKLIRAPFHLSAALPSEYRTLSDALEQYIDAHSDHGCGVQNALDMVSRICWDKAAHLEENWQDTASAKVWKSRAQRIDRCFAALGRHLDDN
jgi:hypothetical protein